MKLRGHDMTEEQAALCSRVWELVDTNPWFSLATSETSCRLEDTYESETRRSCVNWRDKEDWGLRDTLPRSADYTTEGYTDEFIKWAMDRIASAVAEGVTSVDEVCMRIEKTCPVKKDREVA